MKRFIQITTFSLLLLLFLSSNVFSQFTKFEAIISYFDAEVATGVAKDSAGCITVAIFEGDKVIWSKGYGWADIENQIPATAETIGRIGSISKSVTAVAMMQLVERGIFI